jgi:hypothetical protein
MPAEPLLHMGTNFEGLLLLPRACASCMAGAQQQPSRQPLAVPRRLAVHRPSSSRRSRFGASIGGACVSSSGSSGGDVAQPAAALRRSLRIGLNGVPPLLRGACRHAQ